MKYEIFYFIGILNIELSSKNGYLVSVSIIRTIRTGLQNEQVPFIESRKKTKTWARRLSLVLHQNYTIVFIEMLETNIK